jgi:hypothetical protein
VLQHSDEANQQSPDKEATVAKKQLTTKFRLPKAKLLLFTPTGKAVPMQPESEADRVIRLAYPISYQLFRETLSPLQRADLAEMIKTNPELRGHGFNDTLRGRQHNDIH